MIFHCSNKIVDGTEVVVENISKKPLSSNEEIPKKLIDEPPSGHKDIITDILLMNKPQQLIITSGYDGTIKMWK